MSRHLSGVTLARLESRRENIDRTNTETLVCLDDVYGHLRCVEDVTFKNHRTIWTGENDGRVIIRDYVTSKPIYSIERKTCNVFVDCLQYAGEGRIWAGMTDGTIRIFEVRAARIMDEFKAHTSGVTAMTVSNMKIEKSDLEHYIEVVITCSADWSIAKWDAATSQCLGRLQGHTNSVRCLYATSNGEFLMSGGNDGMIRLWCLSTNMEMTKITTKGCGWPLNAHDGKSVTGIVGVESSGYVVSVGADGSAQAHEISISGSWIREVERRPVSLSSVFYDVIHKRIWIGGVDGFISLFDEKLPEMRLINSLHDHSGAYVSAIKSFGTHISHEVWTLDRQGVLCKYTESNTQFHGHYPSLLIKEDVAREVCEDLQTEIDDLRGVVVKNYNEIQAFRQQLNMNESMLSNSLDGVTLNLSTKAKFMFMGLKYLRIKEVPRRLKNCSSFFHNINVMMNQTKWYLRWLVINTALRRKHAEIVFSIAMRNAFNSLFAQQSYAESMNDHKHNVFISCMSHCSKSLLSSQTMMRYYRMWYTYHCDVYKENQLKKMTLRALARSSSHALMHKYWKALQAFRIRKSRYKIMLSFLLINLRRKSNDRMTFFFKKWERYISTVTEDGSRSHCRMKLSNHSDKKHVHFYFTRWCLWLERKRSDRANEDLALLDMEYDSWNTVICHSNVLTDDCLTKERSKAIEDYKSAIDDFEEAAQDTAREQYKINNLKRELAMIEYTDKVKLGASACEQLEATMQFFRSRGVLGISDYTVVSGGKELYEKVAGSGFKGGTVALTNRRSGPLETLIGMDAPKHPFTYALMIIRRLLETSLSSVGITPHQHMTRRMSFKTHEINNDICHGMTNANLGKRKESPVCSQSSRIGDDSRRTSFIGTSRRTSVTSSSFSSSVNVATRRPRHYTSEKSDWGFTETEISKLSVKQSSRIIDALKQLLVVYDACQALRNEIPKEGIEEFIINSFVLMPLLTPEAQKAASEYVKKERATIMETKKVTQEASRKIRQEVHEKHGNYTSSTERIEKMQRGIESHAVGPSKSPRASSHSKKMPTFPSSRRKEPDCKLDSQVIYRGEESVGHRYTFQNHMTTTEEKVPFLGLKVKPQKYNGNTEIVTVQSVTGPSEAAGLQGGDEIIRVGGKVVTNLKGFNALVTREASRPGIRLTIMYDRNGKSMETTIIVGER